MYNNNNNNNNNNNTNSLFIPLEVIIHKLKRKYIMLEIGTGYLKYNHISVHVQKSTAHLFIFALGLFIQVKFHICLLAFDDQPTHILSLPSNFSAPPPSLSLPLLTPARYGYIYDFKRCTYLMICAAWRSYNDIVTHFKIIQILCVPV